MKKQWSRIRRWGKETAQKFHITSQDNIMHVLRSSKVVTYMILVYITCESREQAEDMGRQLLKKRLVGCVNIIPGMRSAYLWPPGKNYVEEADEVILLCKTTENHYKEIEKEVLKLHTYKNPAIFALPILHMSKKYAGWLTGELKNSQRKKKTYYHSLWEAIENISKLPNKPMGELSEEDKVIYGE